MKEKLKVYHGLPKTPITDDTVFYADSSIFSGNVTYLPSITGYSIKSDNILPLGTPSKVSTVEFWINGNVIDGTDTRFFLLRSGGSYVNFRTGNDNTLHVDVYIKETNTVHYSWVYLADTKQNSTYNHVRVVFDTEKLNIAYYINGVPCPVRTDKKPFEVMHKVLDNVVDVKFDVSRGFSDFHLSSAVNYDYFPTLPQDFIDGKAIVVPALNQRQSYGDPVLHQVTELLVPYATSENNPYSNVPVDGLYTHKTKPELSVNGADLWGTNSKIRITGLNNTVITGVFDTDTALCRVVEKAESLTNTDITVKVDDVSRLNVGDTVRIFNSNLVKAGSYDYQIGSIDTSSNSITILSVGANTIIYVGDFLFETTASSSSPVVKTVDGTTVNGTWSGLGTSEATFTLGSNSNIVGKDLVVTYCLSAIGNSSPYPKMPSEVIRGYDELGNELVPVSIPVFKDDFRGKVKGNLDVCPHYASFLASPTLTMPTSFAPDSYINYAGLYSQDDDLLILSNNNQTTNVSQVCFSFDVLSLLKHKLGKDDLTIQQAINLIESINFNVYGYGHGNNVHALNTTVYVVDTNEWSGNVETHNESKVTHLLKSTGAIARVIDSKGFTHFLVYTNACGSYESTLVIDYVNIELVLKTEERFTYLALDEEDIDRSKKCNPILVDMQTKEVKRLLPSKTPFSTEVLLYDLPSMNLANATEVLRGDFAFCTTNGSGKSCEVADTYRGCIGKMGQPSYTELNDVIHSTHIGSNQRTKLIPRQFYHTSTSKNEYSYDGDLENIPFMSVGCDLFESNKELYLRTFFQHINGTKRTKYEQIFTSLPNRPLIK